MSEDEKEKAAAPAKKKGSKKWLLLLIVVLVLGGGAAGGAFWWMRRGDATEGKKEEAHEAEHAAENSGVLALEPFTLNLADQDAARFLRATVNLVISDAEHVEEIKKNELVLMRLRSAVLEVLAVQTADKVVTPDGKAELKKAIVERTSPVLAPVKVTDVLFSDFVVQF
jgi:flagellar protein FliL